MPDLPERGQFLTLAAVFQGGLVVLAGVLGWLSGINPMHHFDWRWQAIGWGALAALPILAVFVATNWFRARGLLTDFLGPLLASCSWLDLVALALLAGISEEVLFRGVLQPWFDRLGEPAGLIGSNIIFGLAHCITPLYAVIAGITGVYLGLLLKLEGEPNLLVPITTHAVYDFLAFLVVLRVYRGGPASDDENGGDDESLDAESLEDDARV
ncbi:MAG: CPBP family intramembrane metalloprotease [Planctomycetes bacterium]|nr:CPBP family intramembrane metalloprotease [Planctomycetota bacterium]